MKILIKDDLHPEDNAMLQALYSRSPASVEDHIRKVAKSGSGKFMQEYYVGYNHASIGDCGSTTIYIEGVSMLVAKAIQDNPLYSGQEASTRYMDFSDTTFDLPDDSNITFDALEGNAIQMSWMEFYHKIRPRVLSHLEELHPYPSGKGPEYNRHERALNARAFDILRGFIPAGARTNLSWHTNLRQAQDKLMWLEVHPEPNVRKVAVAIRESLAARYPNSGFSQKDIPEGNFWRTEVMGATAYNTDQNACGLFLPRFDATKFAIPTGDWSLMLGERPPRMLLPAVTNSWGTITSEFLLDFGSFRDLQRHRNGVIRMPLLTTNLGFHSWYFEQLPKDLLQEAIDFVGKQTRRIEALEMTPVEKQAYIAMGFQVACQVSQTLAAYVYRLELRTAQTVHPTLRKTTQQEAASFQVMFPSVALHVNWQPDIWSTRRGDQTIFESKKDT